MLKIELETDNGDYNTSCTIKRCRKITFWHELTRQEKVKVVNTLGNFYALFYRNLKEE